MQLSLSHGDQSSNRPSRKRGHPERLQRECAPATGNTLRTLPLSCTPFSPSAPSPFFFSQTPLPETPLLQLSIEIFTKPNHQRNELSPKSKRVRNERACPQITTSPCPS